MTTDPTQKIRDNAPDRDNREAMLLINDLNDRFARARNNLRRDDQTFYYMKPLNNPAISLWPTKNNVWEDVAITYGGDKICNWDGIPSWSTVLDVIEKHFKTKIRYY